MPLYDFGKQLTHRTGSPVTTASCGLSGIEGIWNEAEDYFKPIQVGTLMELLLLYTLDRKTQQRPPPGNVLSEEDKRNRFSLAYKVRDNGRVDLSAAEVETLRLVITVLGVEPNGLCHGFLDSPEV